MGMNNLYQNQSIISNKIEVIDSYRYIEINPVIELNEIIADMLWTY